MVSLFGQLIVDGLGMGLVYVMLSSGLVLILSIPRIFFIAYGQFYMLGAYVVWGSLVVLRLPYFVALGLAVIATGVLGVISYRLIFYFMRNAKWFFLANAVAAIALMMILNQLGLLIFGTSSRGVPNVFPGMVEVGGVKISLEKLVLILLVLLVSGVLYFVVQKTKTGRAMRAVAFNADVASLQGIHPVTTYVTTMGIASALSGFAGGIMAPVYAISPDMGSIIINVLLVIILGGIGSLPGAVLGGLVLGMTMSFGYYIVGGGLAQILLYAVIGVILIFRPGGLLGRSGEGLAAQ
jgi:branched-chain amino acid transport system permease protein